MPQAIVSLGEYENRILNIVKGKFGLRNKSEAINFVLKKYEEKLEPEIRPEYVEKLEKIRKEGYGETFTSIKQLRKKIERRQDAA